MQKVTSKDGTKIAYDKLGEGQVLILVLGALNKRGSGKKLAKLLSGNFTVISYDRRGRGASTDTLPYEIDKEIDDLNALIDELGGSAYLYGHSSGAVLALLTAEKLGQKIKGLALYEVPYNGDPEARKASKEYRDKLNQLLAEGKREDAVALFVKSVGVTDKQIAAMKGLPLWGSLAVMADTLKYDTIELMERYPKIGFANIRTPTMIMYGGASPAFMGNTARQLTQVIPQAKIRPLENQTHDVRPDAVAPILKEFFK